MKSKKSKILWQVLLSILLMATTLSIFFGERVIEKYFQRTYTYNVLHELQGECLNSELRYDLIVLHPKDRQKKQSFEVTSSEKIFTSNRKLKPTKVSFEINQISGFESLRIDSIILDDYVIHVRLSCISYTPESLPGGVKPTTVDADLVSTTPETIPPPKIVEEKIDSVITYITINSHDLDLEEYRVSFSNIPSITSESGQYSFVTTQSELREPVKIFYKNKEILVDYAFPAENLSIICDSNNHCRVQR